MWTFARCRRRLIVARHSSELAAHPRERPSDPSGCRALVQRVNPWTRFACEDRRALARVDRRAWANGSPRRLTTRRLPRPSTPSLPCSAVSVVTRPRPSACEDASRARSPVSCLRRGSFSNVKRWRLSAFPWASLKPHRRASIPPACPARAEAGKVNACDVRCSQTFPRTLATHRRHRAPQKRPSAHPDVALQA